jgi:hypothetical protein
MTHTLADLLAPAGIDDFLQHFLGKTRWLRRGDARRSGDALLPWKEIGRRHNFECTWS